MKITINKKKVDVLDECCARRPCLWVGEWKGNIIPGVGYQYAPKSRWHLLCFKRERDGCPHPIPEPEARKIRGK